MKPHAPGRRLSRKIGWGRWYLDEYPGAGVFLCYQRDEEPSENDYDCNLAFACDWAEHVSRKDWATAEVMDGLRRALRDCQGKTWPTIDSDHPLHVVEVA